jgi:hypothetical protein
VRPDASTVPAMPLVDGSERRESLAFGRNYEPEGALSA